MDADARAGRGKGCLAGFRVVEIGQYIPGPYAGLLLAGMGADVVKVEPPGGDPFRQFGPADEDGTWSGYKALNAGKSIVTLDLKADADQAKLASLLKGADVLLESFRPGVLDRLGFPHKRLAELNAGLVHVAVSGWGQTGPYRDRAGHDINYMAMGGGLVASGPAAGPAFAFPPTSDFAGGMQAAMAVVCGLLRREREGQGARADVSMMETVLAWQTMALNDALRKRPPERRRTLLSGGAACYHVYRTRDARFLSLGAIEEPFWKAFCTALERPQWIPRQWEPMPQRDLIAEVADCIAARTLTDWRAVLDDVDCCAEPVWTWQELSDHPHVAARGLLQRLDADPPLATLPQPMILDGAPPPPLTALRPRPVDEVVKGWSDRATPRSAPARGKMASGR